MRLAPILRHVYADDFAISRNRWEGTTRPYAYSLALGDIAFADFSLDDEGRLFLVRISFDGYGCCNPDPSSIEPMAAADSLDLIGRLESGEQLETDHVRQLLRHYFEAHRTVIWEDALTQWGLVSADLA